MSQKLTSVALAEPCRAKLMLFGCGIPDPSDGRERVWVTNMNEAAGGELISIDFERDEAAIYHWPTGHGSWHILPLSGDRLAISTYGGGAFLVFDMQSKEWLHSVEFPGEGYIWDMALGSDGRIYGGTYAGARLAALDPDTGEFEDCGKPPDLHEQNQYLRHVKATPSGDIACTFGFAERSFFVYRIRERRWSLIWKGEDTALFATIRGHLFVSTPEHGLTALAGEEPWPVETPPLPECPVEAGWSGVQRYSTDERVFLSARGTGMWQWLPDSDDLSMIFDANLVGGRIFGVSDNGTVVGIRGQDYWVSTGISSIELRRVPAESRGRRMHFLVGGASGKLWAGPPFGQTVCWYDPRTGEYFNSGQIVNAGGEVYGAVEVDGKLYTASYSGSDFAVYDPSEPWDQWNNVNPRRILSISDHDVIRPTARMFEGPDGMLYSGWQAGYGRYGGALVRFDPRTEEVTVWADPLGEEAVVGLALDDRYAYIGSNLSANGLPTRPGDGSLGVFDLRQERIIHTTKVPGDPSVRPMGAMRASDGRRLLIIPVDDTARVFDVDLLEFTEILAVETPGSPGDREDMLTTEDGSLMYARGEWLVVITPELKVEHHGPLGRNVEYMTYGHDGRLYCCSGATLYRVDGF